MDRKRAAERRQSILPVRAGNGGAGGDDFDDDSEDDPIRRGVGQRLSGRSASALFGRAALDDKVMTLELVKRADFPQLKLDNHKSISSLVEFYTEWEQFDYHITSYNEHHFIYNG